MIGRFISPDSLTPNLYNSQTLDRYAYTLNNPLKYTDPSGHAVITLTVSTAGYALVKAGIFAGITHYGMKAAWELGQWLGELTQQAENINEGEQSGQQNGQNTDPSDGNTFSEEELQEQADQAVNDLLENSSNKMKRKKSAVVGAYDIKTGKVAADYSGPVPEDVNEQLEERANQIGGINSKGINGKNNVGSCAEQRTGNKLLNNGSEIDNIRFRPTRRPSRPEVKIDPCENCREIFPEGFED